ncbi:MAG: hypothetical protein GX031_04595 [Candidatus Riflebacteria bacterium]|nr:hypothetical protein [Candidatus Riflebacteria bacterium]
MTKPEKLIQSYVLEKFFVSTAYRQCSAAIESPPWYYETIVFSWDKETKKTNGILEVLDSGSEPGDALVSHSNTCLKYFVQLKRSVK